MLKRLVCVLFVLFFAACAYDYEGGTVVGNTNDAGAVEFELGLELGEREIITPEDARERLLEMGWETEWLDSVAENELNFVSLYNQSRFFEFVENIQSGRPIGESGEIIVPHYFGGLKFDEMGFLVVSVLPAGFDDPATSVAVEEMISLGIIIRQVQFNYRSIMETVDRLNTVIDETVAAGASSWGVGAENAVTVWLDPYTDEQKAIFTAFLVANEIDPSMILIQQAVTQGMLDWRVESVAKAIASAQGFIVPVGDVDVSRLEIGFSLQNTTDEIFNYGSPWDLARYEDGEWLPVPHLPRAGAWEWTDIGFSLQGGEIGQYRTHFERFFGELPNGRYIFIRDGWLGEWSVDRERVYALVEFEIMDTTPLSP